MSLSLLLAWLCMTISLWFPGPVMNSAVLSLGREEANISDGQRAARVVPDPISGRLLVPSSSLGPFTMRQAGSDLEDSLGRSVLSVLPGIFFL